jgi:enoyl-CoA hydratase/carnithine racemase
VTQHVLVEKSEKLLILTLNRPDKKNALTRAMYSTLATEITNADADPNIRCILIKANGDMFTAGNDLADLPPSATPLRRRNPRTPIRCCRRSREPGRRLLRR